MSIEVINPGLQLTVQDQGRSGFYHLGIPPSGSMDQVSALAANLLVGNPAEAALLEFAILGPQLLFNDSAVIAITGASMEAKLDDMVQPSNTALQVSAGQTLTFGFPTSGARGYLAVAGGIDVPVALGSRATYELGSLGGFHGRALTAGDRLDVSEPATSRESKHLPEDLRMPTPREVELRVVEGLYDYRVEPDSLARFWASEWTVGSEANRVGYRLKGGSGLDFVPREPPFGAGDDPSNITDACYPIGSVQVPSGTEPIILHRDAVSGGGYMMVGTVITADMDRIGQMAPNTTTHFRVVSYEEALEARRERSRWLERIKQALT